MKLLRLAGYALAVLTVIALVGMLVIYILSERALADAPKPRPARFAQPTPAQLADAPRQLHVLGCLSCHGDKLQGEIFLDDPKLARLYAPNLTLLAARATDQQLEQGIRQGIGYDGRPLLIMPSEGYQFLTDAEVTALIAAIRRMPTTGQEQPPVSVGPVGRLALAAGKLRSAPKLVAEFHRYSIPDFGPRFARGRHIVEVNCSECHGPDLRGMEVEPGIVSADLAIAGAYDLDQFKTMLRKGVGPGNKDIGLMGDVARSDFRYLTDEEIADIHAYLVERANRAP